MKLKFKQQAFQTDAVNSVVDCFKGQPYISAVSYHVDPGYEKNRQQRLVKVEGFENPELSKKVPLLENIQEVQRRQNIPISNELVKTNISPINLDIEMETGTGKTYCYIKTMFELNKKYGWCKFIVVVPSIAIREGVYKSLEITAEHFQETYHKKAKYFIYNSKEPHHIEAYSSDAEINVMVINFQAFNARGKDARRIYEVLDDFQSRRPIDVIKANRPIVILDEPQKMEGKKTLDSLKEFAPMMVLRYSATHKTTHNKIYRLDALDAYNQKLVKKISVRGITTKTLTGTNGYLYLESIEISKQDPVARIEIEIKQQSAPKRALHKLKKGDNLFDLSNKLDQYKGFVISDINAINDTVSFTNGIVLEAGIAYNDENEKVIRHIQIREAIKTHFEKERELFHQRIKVLSLFFIDEVEKYRVYNEDGTEGVGEYAKIFEEEYLNCLNDEPHLFQPKYKEYLDKIKPSDTHNGYFSIDKKSKRLINPETKKSSDESDDVNAYDLILKEKERLLSFEEPTRFIFSHSALREGWDNPNVFVICALKHSDNTITRRQEVGRGLRLSVNQDGERQDDPATVHQTNVLTVVASESYKDFVSALQNDISESLSECPRIADVAYFTGKVLQISDTERIEVSQDMAEGIEFYLIQNGYVDKKRNITKKFIDDKETNQLKPLPEDLSKHKDQIILLVDSVYSDVKLPEIGNYRGTKANPLNDNFKKKEFKELWDRINSKAVYNVYFDSDELIIKCIRAIDKELKVKQLVYTIEAGDQADEMDFDELAKQEAFNLTSTNTEKHRASIHSSVKYDLIGKITESVLLTRKTVTKILSQIHESSFAQFSVNPESFISETSRLINEQKATMIIEHLAYDVLTETYDIDIFTKTQTKQDFSKSTSPLKRHIYDYVITDSNIERDFAQQLDKSSDVVVYAKLPKGFFIPTPVGPYNPDWAIAFREGSVKHVYFVAETKGDMSTMQLKKIEETKIECARKFFEEVNKKIDPNKVRYDVVDSYERLLDIVEVKKAS